MKISPLRKKFAQFIEIQKYRKEERFINNYVTIHNDSTYGDSYKQMYKARKTMANYAADKGVKIDIYDARHELGEHDSPIVENDLAEKLSVYVTNLLSNKQTKRFVSARTDEIHPHVVNDYFVVEIPSDGIQQVRLTKHEYEDTFLRNLYRNIEDMTNKVLNNK